MTKYQPQKIDSKWSKIWEQKGIYQPDLKEPRPFYNLMMFPYPSAEGLHVGNVYAFTGSDIYGRFKRMQGYQVFEPIGLDGFGIHSENYALKVNKHPAEQAKISEKHFYRQLHSIGNAFAWRNTLETYDPQYYQWTQWIFIQMFKAGLAYRKKSSVNFCPSCKTVLSDEQVINGVCERCQSTVVKKELAQWFFRITKYAERLLKNLKEIDWSEKVKIAQKNWIGKKEGINIKYQILKSKYQIECFTTRPDTNFGATFVVMAPEHPILAQLLLRGDSKGLLGGVTKQEVVAKRREIKAYIKQAKKKTTIDRVAEGREKTGVFTGFYCLNQLNNIKMPLYISDFVLMEFGTGAVVGVPGHDLRDFEFAQKFKLPVVRVVVGSDDDASSISRIEQVQEKEGRMVNSEFLNGMDIHQATKAMMGYIEKKGWGKRVTTFRLRDWCISRQRYWGPPIPMVNCKKCGWAPVPEKDLPVLLPKVKDWRPKGEGKGPLAKMPEFYKTKCPQCGGEAERETDVSDTFLDSAWYFLRYPSISSGQKNTSEVARQRPRLLRGGGVVNNIPWDSDVTKKWLPVDMYIGGAEHSVLHLMYSRFLWMVFYDLGYFDFSSKGRPRPEADQPVAEASGWEEPFKKFRAHGLLISEGAKMSKSKGNVIIPDEYIKKYGADTLRMYLMFLGPFSQGGDFRDEGIIGLYRFLGKVWRMVTCAVPPPRWQAGASAKAMTPRMVGRSKKDFLKRLTHQTIKKVTEDIENLRYNTAIAALMEYFNKMSNVSAKGLNHRPIGLWPRSSSGRNLQFSNEEYKEGIKILLLLLAPFAPFITEELWQRFNKKESDKDTPGVGFDSPGVEDFNSIHLQPWPEYDKNLIKEEEVTVVVEINGKVRSQMAFKVQPQRTLTSSRGLRPRVGGASLRGMGLSKEEVEKRARNEAKVKKYLSGKKIKRVVFVPGKLINFVTD